MDGFRVIDTHAHLNDKSYKHDIGDVIDKAEKAGVYRIINVGYDIESSKKAIEMSKRHKILYSSIGIHPHDAKDAPINAIEKLEKMAEEPKVVALGEMGLDYYRDLSPRDIQRDLFISQLELSKKLGIPFVIHDRDAHGEILDVLKIYGKGQRGVLHCFSGSVEMAKECVKLGFYISIAGPVTYKNARKLIDVVREVPIDRLLIETDCPYLTPEPHRGKRNEPSLVIEVAKKIAEIKEEDLQGVAKVTTKNALELFNRIQG
jgi:TatD DNase family protein